MVVCEMSRSLRIADGKGGAETSSFGYKHSIASCSCGTADAATIFDLEHNAAFHNAYPLVVVEGQPRLGGCSCSSRSKIIAEVDVIGAAIVTTVATTTDIAIT